MNIRFPTMATNLTSKEIEQERVMHGKVVTQYPSYCIMDHKDIMRIDGYSEDADGRITGALVIQRNGDSFFTTMLPDQVVKAKNYAESRELIFKSDVTRSLMIGEYKN